MVVGGLMVWVVVRYRSRPTDDNTEPIQIYGSNQIELSWTVIPILLVFMLFLTTARVIFATESIPKPASALDVTVIGHQFWWEYRYPSLGIVTANELHVPVSTEQAASASSSLGNSVPQSAAASAANAPAAAATGTAASYTVGAS